MICSIRIRVRFGQTLLAACKSCYFRRVFKAKEKQDGNPTKSPDETYARTADCDVAGNALRLYRENWTLSKYRAPSLARSASTCSGDFGTQQNHRIHEPLQSRGKALSRRCFACRRTQKFAGKFNLREIQGRQVQPFCVDRVLCPFARGFWPCV